MTNKPKTLQSQLADAVEDVFGVRTLEFWEGNHYTKRIEDMTSRQIAAIFRGGKRIANDNWNSQGKVKTQDRMSWFDSWWAALGVTVGVGKGGGGPRLSYEAKAERAILEEFFASPEGGGKDGKVAKKMAVGANRWEDATRIVLISAMHEAGMTGEEIKNADFGSKIPANLDAVKANFAPAIAEKAKALEEADKKLSFTSQVAGLKL
jgi:hypothetical protein